MSPNLKIQPKQLNAVIKVIKAMPIYDLAKAEHDAWCALPKNKDHTMNREFKKLTLPELERNLLNAKAVKYAIATTLAIASAAGTFYGLRLNKDDVEFPGGCAVVAGTMGFIAGKNEIERLLRKKNTLP